MGEQLRVQVATAKNYASSLLTRWQFGPCGVLVFCSKDDAVVGS